MFTFALPTPQERRANVKPKLTELKAARVMAYTAINHNCLWFYVLLDCPSPETRDKLAKYFILKDKDVFVYVIENNHALEVW